MKKTITLIFFLCVFQFGIFGQSQFGIADARAALASGIEAESQGAVAAALVYYFQAVALDPTLQEAINRSSILSANINSGNIGVDARNEIELRRRWLAILTETEKFFYEMINRADPPYILFYSTAIQQGRINFQAETIELYILTNLRTTNRVWFNSISQAANVIYTGLFATGRMASWGLGNWPQQGLSDTNPFSRNWRNNFAIEFELLNEQNRVIGRQTLNLAPTFVISPARQGNRFEPPILSRFAENIFSTVTFNSVKVDDITENLTIRISGINGSAPENTRIQITALSDSRWQEYNLFQVYHGLLRGFSNWENERPQDLVLPSELWGELNPITRIDHNAFSCFSGRGNFRSITIPDSVISIGTMAFNDHGLQRNLTKLVIGNNVRTIESFALDRGENLTTIIIGENVRFDPHNGGRLRSFIRFYNENNRQAGTYTFEGTGRNARWVFNR